MSPETERRKQPRNMFVRHVEYMLPPDTGMADQEGSRGVTVNMSSSGLCLYVFKPLSAGQELKIIHGIPGKKKAMVQWIEQITVDTYKAGLQFAGA